MFYVNSITSYERLDHKGVYVSLINTFLLGDIWQDRWNHYGNHNSPGDINSVYLDSWEGWGLLMVKLGALVLREVHSNVYPIPRQRSSFPV